MSSKKTLNTYGFDSPANGVEYEKFVAEYLPVLARRQERWCTFNGNESKAKVLAAGKFKRFVRKGVPPPLRPRVWLASSGAQSVMSIHINRFLCLIAKSQADIASVEQIAKDLHRTFPNNRHFREIEGEAMRHQLDLLLRALAARFPSIGYCQGLNYVCAMLLLVMKVRFLHFSTIDAEAVFWLIDVSIPNVIGYYAQDMVGIIVDMKVLEDLLKSRAPEIAAKLASLNLDLLLLCSKWFICWFIETLPLETVLRIWDCFFNEGPKIFFRVALTLLIKKKSQIIAAKSLTTISDILTNLSKDPYTIECHQFMEDIFTIPGTLPWTKIEELRRKHSAK